MSNVECAVQDSAHRESFAQLCYDKLATGTRTSGGVQEKPLLPVRNRERANPIYWWEWCHRNSPSSLHHKAGICNAQQCPLEKLRLVVLRRAGSGKTFDIGS